VLFLASFLSPHVLLQQVYTLRFRLAMETNPIACTYTNHACNERIFHTRGGKKKIL